MIYRGILKYSYYAFNLNIIDYWYSNLLVDKQQYLKITF